MKKITILLMLTCAFMLSTSAQNYFKSRSIIQAPPDLTNSKWEKLHPVMPLKLPPHPKKPKLLKTKNQNNFFSNTTTKVSSYSKSKNNRDSHIISTNANNPKTSLGENGVYYAVVINLDNNHPHQYISILKNTGDPSNSDWTGVLDIYNNNVDLSNADIEIISSDDRGIIIFKKGINTIESFWFQLSDPLNNNAFVTIYTGTSPLYCSVTSDEIDYNGTNVYIYVTWLDNLSVKFTKSVDQGTSWNSTVNVVQNLSGLKAYNGNSISYCPGNHKIYISYSVSSASNNDVLVAEQTGTFGDGTFNSTTVMNNCIGSGAIASYGNHILVTSYLTYNGSCDICYVYSDDGGNSWSNTIFFNWYGNQNFPSVSINDNGYFCLLYGGDTISAKRNIYNNLGGSWSVGTVDPISSSNPTSACLSSGTSPNYGGAYTNSLDSYFGWASTPPVDYITVTSPNGGENWQAGSTHNITWNDNISGNVLIKLYKGSSFNSTITSSTPSDGSYSWTIPSGQQAGTDYTVKITSVDNSSIYDFSDGNFEISSQPPPDNITVISPNGNENWQAGSTHNITWNDNISGNVLIKLYKGSSFNSTITSSIPSDGSYSWTIPSGQQAGTDYTVKITSVDNSSIYDFSDGNFEISSQPPPDNITVISPNGNENWQAGSTHNITWNDNISGNVLIKLYKGSSFNSTITSSTPSDGSYSWTIPSGQQAGIDYTVKITSIDNFSVSDFSDGDFEISSQPPPDNITVISPNGGEVWQAGTTHTIMWDDNISENVKIELHKGGSNNLTITNSTSSDGSYSWTIPSGQQAGTDYTVKITSVDNSSIYDFSAGYFEISPQSAPHISLSPPSKNFGSIQVGNSSSEYPFTLTNDGTGTATGSVSLTGSDANQFEITSGGGSFSLSQNQTKTINVKFKPTSEGDKTATLFANGESPCNEASSSLSGKGITNSYLTVSPTSIILNGHSGDSKQFNISSNITWQITGYPSWLDLSSISGSNDATINVTTNSTNTGVERTATLNVDGNGVSTQNVSITQQSTSGVDDEIIEKLISIYPNPASLQLNVKFQDIFIKDVSIIIYDIHGNILDQKHFRKLPSKIIQLNLSNYANGVYYIHINNNKVSLTKQIIVVK